MQCEAIPYLRNIYIFFFLQEIFNFIGSQENSTQNFEIIGPDGVSIYSRERKDLKDLGILQSCTWNVHWGLNNEVCFEDF